MDEDDYKQAQRELHEARNELRKLRGLDPLPFPYIHPKDAEPPYCSFCGLAKNEVKKLISGPGVYICDSCVNYCVDILNEEHPEND